MIGLAVPLPVGHGTRGDWILADEILVAIPIVIDLDLMQDRVDEVLGSPNGAEAKPVSLVHGARDEILLRVAEGDLVQAIADIGHAIPRTRASLSCSPDRSDLATLT